MNNQTLGNLSLGDLSQRLANMEDYVSQLGALKVAEDVTEDWLQIPFRFTSVAPASTSLLTQTVAGDGPFDLIEITYTAVDSTGASNNLVQVRIREGEAVGRSLSLNNSFVNIDNTAGSAQRPYIIKGRRRFRANIAIVVEITNNSTNANTIEVNLHGIKVFSR